MIDILDKIRKPCIFILLLILNLWFFSTVVFNDREEILYFLLILFFFLSFDYKAIRREYLYWLLLFIGISFIDFNSHKLNVLTPLVLMQCVSRLNIRTYLLYNIIILGGTALILFLSVGTGTSESTNFLDFARTRSDFGFRHPNIAALYYWGLFISLIFYCYLSRYRNLLWILLAIIFAISIFIYTKTISRSFIISIVIFYVIWGYYSLRQKINRTYVLRWSKYIVYPLPIILTALTLYFSIQVKKYQVLDILLSMRLSLSKQFLDTLSPMQYVLGSNAFDRIVVDSSYLHLLFEIGVLLFGYFIWLYYFAIRNIIKQQNPLIIAFFVSTLVYALSESLLLLPMFIGNNIFWVLLYKYRVSTDEDFNLTDKMVS